MTSLSKWGLTKHYFASILLASALVFAAEYCSLPNTIKTVRENILIILVALFAITMPAIGSLATKVIELKQIYKKITLLPMKEINKTLYEQTIPILVAPFLLIGYDYCSSKIQIPMLLWLINVVVLSFLFHSIFVIFDIFRAFTIIANAVSTIIDNENSNDNESDSNR